MLCLQSLDDGRYALMKAKISSVIHDDTKYQKGMLHMRTQKCFAVKVGFLFLLYISLVHIDFLMQRYSFKDISFTGKTYMYFAGTQ